VVSAQSGGIELDRNAEAVADGRRGLEAWQRGDYAACRKSFSRAESISHSPVFVLYLARCLERQGQLLEARRLYGLVADERLDDTAPAAWRSATTDAVRERTDLAPRIPSIVVSVRNARTRELSVALDGASVGSEQLSTPWELDPGEHRLQATGPDGARAETRFTLAEGQRSRAVELVFPPPARKRPPPGSRHGHPSGPAASASFETAGYVAAGVGLAGLIAGAITGTMAWARLADIKDSCDGNVCDPNLRESMSDVRALTTVSDLSFVIAAGGLTTSAVFLWVLPPVRAGTTPHPASGSGALVGFGSAF
jgi:hypothetical protein